MSKIAVIGCGVFGALTALKLADSGHNVTIIERLHSPMLGASHNNQNRLHLGFHYPRSPETARQCIAGYKRFVSEYSDCVTEGFQNAYFIASENSQTSAEEFINFCDSVGLSYQKCEIKNFPAQVNHVDLCITTGEGVYDSGLVGKKIMRRFEQTRIKTYFGNGVTGINNKGERFELTLNSGNTLEFDGVVNATYANQNRLNQLAGFKAPQRQFEYTVVPIIDVPIGKVGITIMDGPFMTILPYGLSRQHLLYHVRRSVIETNITPLLDQSWLDKSTSPFSKIDKETYFDKCIQGCSDFIPDLKKAKLKGFLEGPRMVFKNVEDTDARPSEINRLQDNFISVFSGKTDHSIWVADEVERHLKYLL